MRPWPDRFLHPALRDDAEVRRRARLAVLLSVVLVATAATYGAYYGLVVGYRSGALVLLAGAVAAALLLPLLRWRPWLRVYAHALTTAHFATLVGIAILEGGAGSLGSFWLSTPPVFAIVLLDRRAAWGWTALCMGAIVALRVAEDFGAAFPVRYPASWDGAMRVGSPVGLVLVTALLLVVFDTMRARAQAEADAAHAALSRLAYHDTLTGLPNRARFLERLAHALDRAQAAGAPERVAVLLLDLDGFKAVNDTLGHAAGDALLAEVATRLLDATRGRDTVSRLGGDEFAVLLEGVRDLPDTAVVADRIVRALAAPFALTQGTARIGTSVGIASGADGACPADADVTAPHATEVADDRVAAILQAADAAMYQAKAAGRGRWVRHVPGPSAVAACGATPHAATARQASSRRSP